MVTFPHWQTGSGVFFRQTTMIGLPEVKERATVATALTQHGTGDMSLT